MSQLLLVYQAHRNDNNSHLKLFNKLIRLKLTLDRLKY